MEITREHKAGLEKVLDVVESRSLIRKNGMIDGHILQRDLHSWIAQASAAPEQAKMCDCNQGRLPCSCKQVSAVPEQEPVIELEAAISRFSGGLSWVVKKPLILPTPQYPEEKFKAYMHADPLSLDHLIDECWHACGGNGSSATREELLSALRLMNEVEDEQDAAIKAATQRADTAERKLGELLAALSQHKQALSHLGLPLGDRLEEAVLFASAEPASPWVKCSDRLPDVDAHVLVAAEFFGPGDWRIKVGGVDEHGDWTVFGASWTPTRWMPLPAVPAKGGDGE